MRRRDVAAGVEAESGTAAPAVEISVDGGGDQQREVAGDERTIRRPEEAE